MEMDREKGLWEKNKKWIVYTNIDHKVCKFKAYGTNQ